MLHATPGRGRICRIEVGFGSQDVPAPTLVPRRTDYDDASTQTVDLVIPHGRREYATGAVVTFDDATAARAFAFAAERAAQMLDEGAAHVETVDGVHA